MKNYLVAAVIFILIIITYTYGRVNKEIIDDINVVTAIGIDKSEKNMIKGTAVIPVFMADKSIESETFQAESILAREVINILQKKSADPLVTGGLKVAIYGEDLAREGINEYVDALQRDASVGSKLYLGIVDGKAEDIMKAKLGNRGTGVYLATLMEHNIQKSDLPQTILHNFLFRYYEKGMDPYLPYLKLEGNKVEIKGLAIFKEEVMIDMIDPVNMFFFKAMVEDFGEGTHTIKLEDTDDYASIKRIVSQREIKVTEEKGDPKVMIEIYLQGVLSEFSGRQTTPETVKKIVKQLEEEIVKRSNNMIEKFQKQNVDPIGIGYIARTSQRNFDEEKWDNGYPNMKVKINAKVDLIQTGVIE